MRHYLLFLAVLTAAACGNNKDQKAQVQEQPQAPLAQSANSAVFNESFGKLMQAYYQLQGNFIAEKEPDILSSARELLLATDSLKLDELKADSTIIVTARTYTDGIVSELKGLQGEKDMEAKRMAFQLVSEQLYDLTRIVQYDREVVYHIFCPMAFNDQGGYWLSRSTVIQNPYIPGKMLGCGEVRDSIDFRPRP